MRSTWGRTSLTCSDLGLSCKYIVCLASSLWSPQSLLVYVGLRNLRSYQSDLRAFANFRSRYLWLVLLITASLIVSPGLRARARSSSRYDSMQGWLSVKQLEKMKTGETSKCREVTIAANCWNFWLTGKSCTRTRLPLAQTHIHIRTHTNTHFHIGVHSPTLMLHSHIHWYTHSFTEAILFDNIPIKVDKHRHLSFFSELSTPNNKASTDRLWGSIVLMSPRQHS